MVIACQSSLGPLYTVRNKPFSVEDVAEGDGPWGDLWECAGFERPVRHFVYPVNNADCVTVEGILRDVSRALFDIAEPDIRSVSVGPASHLAVVVNNLVLPSMTAVLHLNAIAFTAHPHIMSSLRDRVPMTSHSPLITPTPAEKAVDIAKLTAHALPESFAATTHSWHTKYDGASAVHNIPEFVTEEDLPALVMKHVVPGPCYAVYWQCVFTAVARALLAAADGERKEQEAETSFRKWASRDEFSMSATHHALDKILQDARIQNAQQGSHHGQRGAQRLALSREMLDILSERVPQLHEAFIESVGASLTRPLPPGRTEEEAGRPSWMDCEKVTRNPGVGAIGDLTELMNTHKYVAICAPPGFGKTDAAKTTIRNGGFDSAIAITTRVSVADSLVEVYNAGDGPVFLHYKKDFDFAEERETADFLVSELESLVSNNRWYQMVLLDEFMSLLLQVVSKINRGRFKLLVKKLMDLCKHAKNVLIADALLPMSLVSQFVRHVEQGAAAEFAEGVAKLCMYREFVPITPRTDLRAIIHTRVGKLGKEDISGAIETRFQAGHTRLFVFTNMKSLVEQIQQSYTLAFKARVGTEPRVLILSKETYGKFSLKLQENSLDDLWKAYDAIIVTPVVSNCLSFNVENHFDAVLMFVTNLSCLPHDAFQGSRRPRRCTDPTIWVYCATVQISLDGLAAKGVSALADYSELEEEARLRDHTASPLEQLCYKLARRAHLYAFHFYPQYLAKCFEAAGYRVEMVTGALTGKGKPAAMVKREFVPFNRVPMVGGHAGESVIKAAMDRMKTGVLTDDEAREALCISGVAGGDNPRDTLVDVDRRHRFARILLNIESGGERGDLIDLASDAERTALESLYENFCKDEKPLWRARRAILMERHQGQGGKRGESLVQCLPKQLETMMDVSAALGLGQLVPPTDAVERDTLTALAASNKMAELVSRYNTYFEPSAPLKWSSAKTTAGHVGTAVNTIIKGWNPLLEFRASGKRKRAGKGGAQGDTAPFELRWAADANNRNEMDFFCAHLNAG